MDRGLSFEIMSLHENQFFSMLRNFQGIINWYTLYNMCDRWKNKLLGGEVDCEGKLVVGGHYQDSYVKLLIQCVKE